MGSEFVIAGRRELPPRAQPWVLELENEEGGIEVYEAAARYKAVGDFFKDVQDTVGWMPRSVVLVRQAWELGQVAAEELASALEGAVFCDVDGEVFFDAAGKATPAASIQDLNHRLRHAFNHPEPFFKRWVEEEKRRLANDPAAASASDWSDV